MGHHKPQIPRHSVLKDRVKVIKIKANPDLKGYSETSVESIYRVSWARRKALSQLFAIWEDISTTTKRLSLPYRMPVPGIRTPTPAPQQSSQDKTAQSPKQGAIHEKVPIVLAIRGRARNPTGLEESR